MIKEIYWCVYGWHVPILPNQIKMTLGLESVEDNSKHDLAGMAVLADGTIVLTLLAVAFLW